MPRRGGGHQGGHQGRLGSYLSSGSALGATHEAGTTEHALLILTAIEIVLLVWLRGRFKAAHGG